MFLPTHPAPLYCLALLCIPVDPTHTHTNRLIFMCYMKKEIKSWRYLGLKSRSRLKLQSEGMTLVRSLTGSGCVTHRVHHNITSTLDEANLNFSALSESVRY